MSVTVRLPEELSRRLEVAAAKRGVSPEQVAVEAIEAQLPDRSSLKAFIGSGDSGDPDWATTDIQTLRHELAERRAAQDA